MVEVIDLGGPSRKVEVTASGEVLNNKEFLKVGKFTANGGIPSRDPENREEITTAGKLPRGTKIFKTLKFVLAVATEEKKAWLDDRMVSTLERDFAGTINRTCIVEFEVAEVHQPRKVESRTKAATENPTERKGRKKAEHLVAGVKGLLLVELHETDFVKHIEGMWLVTHEDNRFSIAVETSEAKYWIEENKAVEIKKFLEKHMGQEVSVTYRVIKKEEVLDTRYNTLPLFQTQQDGQSSQTYSIDSRYDFDRYAVGPSNSFPFNVAKAVGEGADDDGIRTVYLYGDKGLGKTHLLKAIGNECARGGVSVLYVYAEEFTNELIGAIRTQVTQAFREKYYDVEVLLIDDIHFISGKESTEEELIALLKYRKSNRKQTVLTGNSPPKDLEHRGKPMNEDLKSRLGSLKIKIQQPDEDTCLQTLRTLAQRRDLEIPDRMLHRLIEIIPKDTPVDMSDLHSIITYIWARVAYDRKQVSSVLLEEALTDTYAVEERLGPTSIIKVVSKEKGISKI